MFFAICAVAVSMLGLTSNNPDGLSYAWMTEGVNIAYAQKQAAKDGAIMLASDLAALSAIAPAAGETAEVETLINAH